MTTEERLTKIETELAKQKDDLWVQSAQLRDFNYIKERFGAIEAEFRKIEGLYSSLLNEYIDRTGAFEDEKGEIQRAITTRERVEELEWKIRNLSCVRWSHLSIIIAIGLLLAVLYLKLCLSS